MHRGIAILALGVLASLGSCTPVRKAQADCVPTPDTQCRPRLSGALLDGAQIEATSFKDKVVLVNFWATWCTPCIVEMPAFQKVYERHAGDGFIIVGVLFSDSATDDEVRAFLSDRLVTYPILRSHGEIEAAFPLRGVIPTSFLYDRKGQLVAKWDGALDEAGLEAKVAEALSR